jgi:hypothetical protein
MSDKVGELRWNYSSIITIHSSPLQQSAAKNLYFVQTLLDAIGATLGHNAWRLRNEAGKILLTLAVSCFGCFVQCEDCRMRVQSA